MMMSLKKEMVALAQQQNNYVYIVRCRDQTFYTGWTTFEHKSEALKREYQIKQLKRSEKEKLILSKKKI